MNGCDEMIRKAKSSDIDSVVKIYDLIHDSQDKDIRSVGWIEGVYPTRSTALDALERNDLFVYDDDGDILASAIIDQIQGESYDKVPWDYEVSDDKVCVLHTLVVSPLASGKGIGKEFVRFYEDYAYKNGWYELRMDTNENNVRARSIYRDLSYKEIAIVPTTFNGIPDTNLVMFEKNLKEQD